MAEFTFPTELDDPDAMVAIPGSFWSEVYSGADLVRSLLLAKGQIHKHLHDRIQELADSVSRYKLEPVRRTAWTPLRLKESELVAGNLARWNGQETFNDRLDYDVPADRKLYGWPVDEALKGCGILSSSITDPITSWVEYVDYFIEDGYIWLRENPFQADNLAYLIHTDASSGERELLLWGYGAITDENVLNEQLAYIYGRDVPPTASGKSGLNATTDAVVAGTAKLDVLRQIAAACGVPITNFENEVVELVFRDSTMTAVITDKGGYRFSADAVPTVTVGDTLPIGSSLCNAVELFDLRNPLPAGVKALTLGAGFLPATYGELTFENTDHPTEIDTSGEFTRLEFPVRGLAADVTAFWEAVHAAGEASGTTLAMRLDSRAEAAKTSQPSAQVLPATINPAEFVRSNFLRGNAIAALVRPSAFGEGAVGLSALEPWLRDTVPPESACLILVYYTHTGDKVIMDGDQAEGLPSYGETVTSFSINSITESLLVSGLSERVRVFHVSPECQ